MSKKLSYEEQLLQPEWKTKRLEILKRDNFACVKCDKTADESLLHVHHRYYLAGRLAWEYDNIVFLTFCEKHHIEEGEKIQLFSLRLIEQLKQLGATSDELMEMITILFKIGTIETVIQVLHEYEAKEFGFKKQVKRTHG